MNRSKDIGYKRTCSSCGKLKPRSEKYFSKSSKCVNRLGGVCRDCVNEYMRKWKNDPVRKNILADKRRNSKSERKRENKLEKIRWKITPQHKRA